MLTPTYLPISEISKAYALPRRTVYRMADEIANQPRYKRVRAVIESPKRMVHVLVWDDYLINRAALQDRCLAKHVPDFNMKEIKKMRGEA